MQLDLTDQDIQVIGLALGELPFKISNQLIQKIQGQVNASQLPNVPSQSPSE